MTFARLVTGPTSEPISLSDAKGHLRVDHAEDDQLILRQLKAARRYVEDAIGWALLAQTFDQYWDSWPFGNRPLELLRQPIQSVTFVQYTDSTGAVTTLTANTDYIVDLWGDPPRIAPAFGKLWPGAALAPLNAINARYVAGYATAADVHDELVHAVYMLLAHWYDNRSDVEVDARVRALEVPRTVDDILAKFNPPLMR